MRSPSSLSFRVAGLVAAVGVLLPTAMQDPVPAATSEPSYDDAGALLAPVGWQQWPLAGSSLGLGYSARPPGTPWGTFKHVHLPPEAMAHYAATGRFAEHTMLVMAIYEPDDRAEPAKSGVFADRLVAVEVAVKDSERYADDGGWAYFDFGAGDSAKPRATPFARAQCAACHTEHGAVDNVFVQFYSVLRDARAAHLERGDAPTGR